MLSCHSLRVIDLLLREIMDDNRLFGGKLLILGGDFRQIANVVPRGTTTDIVEMCIKSSPLWLYIQKMSLTKNMRTDDQNDYNNWVLKVGEGKITNNIRDIDPAQIEIDEKYIEKDDIIKTIYGSEIRITTQNEIEEIASKIILSTKNENVDEINGKILQILTGEEKTYLSIDTLITDDINDEIDFPVEFLNAQKPSGMTRHTLKLKVGAFIMLVRNLYPKKGLLNGTRLIIKSLHKNCIVAEIITGYNKGEIVCIPRIDLVSSEDNLPFKMKRRQFPVILAFAMTINKSQGQSFNNVGIYLKEPVFAHGQLYVALSRCRKAENIKIKITETPFQGKINKNKTYTKNVVIQDLLI